MPDCTIFPPGIWKVAGFLDRYSTGAKYRETLLGNTADGQTANLQHTSIDTKDDGVEGWERY